MAAAFALRRIGASAASVTGKLERLLINGQSSQVQRELRLTLDYFNRLGDQPEAPADVQLTRPGEAARFRIIALPMPPADDIVDSYDSFDVTPIGVAAARIQVVSLNNTGVVMGYVGDQIFLYRNGKWEQPKLQAPSDERIEAAHALALNDRGQAAGFVQRFGRRQAFVWRRGDSVSLLPALFERPQDRSRRDCEATGLNNRGQVVGWSQLDPKDNDSNPTYRACLWNGEHPEDLGLLPGGESSWAMAINDDGLVIGRAETGQRAEKLYVETLYWLSRAFAWKNGKMVDLGVLPGFAESEAVAVNSGGIVAGRCYTRLNPGETPADFKAVPFAWRQGRMISLGTFGGPDSYASGVNEHGQIVGRSHTKSDELSPVFHAFLWENGKLLDLNKLIPADQQSRWVLRDARSINDRGQILAVGQLRSEMHNVILDPVQSDATRK